MIQTIYELEKQMVYNRDDRIIALLNERECMICMMEFNSDQKIIFCPHSYKHYFHKDCLLNWFKTQKVCPTCNQPITLGDIKANMIEYNIRVIEEKLAKDMANGSKWQKKKERPSVILAMKAAGICIIINRKGERGER